MCLLCLFVNPCHHQINRPHRIQLRSCIHGNQLRIVNPEISYLIHIIIHLCHGPCFRWTKSDQSNNAAETIDVALPRLWFSPSLRYPDRNDKTQRLTQNRSVICPTTKLNATPLWPSCTLLLSKHSVWGLFVPTPFDFSIISNREAQQPESTPSSTAENGVPHSHHQSIL